MRHRIIAVIEQLPSLDDLNRFVDVLEIRDMLYGRLILFRQCLRETCSTKDPYCSVSFLESCLKSKNDLEINSTDNSYCFVNICELRFKNDLEMLHGPP